MEMSSPHSNRKSPPRWLTDTPHSTPGAHTIGPPGSPHMVEQRVAAVLGALDHAAVLPGSDREPVRATDAAPSGADRRRRPRPGMPRRRRAAPVRWRLASVRPWIAGG